MLFGFFYTLCLDDRDFLIYKQIVLFFLQKHLRIHSEIIIFSAKYQNFETINDPFLRLDK